MTIKTNKILFITLFLLLFVGCRTRKDDTTIRIQVPIITKPNIVSIADCSCLALTRTSTYTSRKNLGPYFVALKDSTFYLCNVEKFDGLPLISIDEEWKYETPITSGRYNISSDSVVTIQYNNKVDNNVIAEFRSELGDTLMLSFDVGSKLYNDYSYCIKYSGLGFSNLSPINDHNNNYSANWKSEANRQNIEIKIPIKDGTKVETIRFEPRYNYMRTISFNINLIEIGANYVNIIDRRIPKFEGYPINYLHFGLINSVFPNPLKAKLTDNSLKILTLDGTISDLFIPLISIQ